ncbi:MAG: CapA family protein [Bacteroidales bacterium]|nr:CapA family protein [Bacteroidales bacterium]
MMTLAFIGDIFPGDEQLTAGFGIRTKTTDALAARWTRNITKTIGEADFIVGNLEAPLVESPRDACFCGHPRFAEILRDAGINVLHLANNHILEHGAEGFRETLATLRSQGLQTVGQLENGQPALLTLQKDGTTVCLGGFCDERVCTIENPACYGALEETLVLETLERMKATGADVLACIFHWGQEYVPIPSPEQRRLAHLLVDNGAHLVVGHHPHVIQPYESYHGGHILYSLGNFCFDDVQSARFGKGMAARISIDRGRIRDIRFSGVRVQDMACSDDLTAPMPRRAFQRCFDGIQRRYARLCRLPDESYGRRYARLHRCLHRRERLLMRVNIAYKLLDIRNRNKAQLLRNIRTYFLR